MKRTSILLVLAGILLLATTALAKNTTNVTGDLGQDGYLTITLDWQVDSARYPGMDEPQVREKVRQEMWKELLPKLVQKTSGYPVSYDDAQFSKVKEVNTLVKRRPDGSEVYDVDLVVRFYCPRYSGTYTAPKNTQEHSQKMDEKLQYRYVRGI